MNIIVVDEDEVPDKSNRQKVIAVHTLVPSIQRRIPPKISLSYFNKQCRKFVVHLSVGTKSNRFLAKNLI